MNKCVVCLLCVSVDLFSVTFTSVSMFAFCKYSFFFFKLAWARASFPLSTAWKPRDALARQQRGAAGTTLAEWSTGSPAGWAEGTAQAPAATIQPCIGAGTGGARGLHPHQTEADSACKISVCFSACWEAWARAASRPTAHLQQVCRPRGAVSSSVSSGFWQLEDV